MGWVFVRGAGVETVRCNDTATTKDKSKCVTNQLRGSGFVGSFDRV